MSFSLPDYLSILNIISLYAISLDTKNFSLLDSVFITPTNTTTKSTPTLHVDFSAAGIPGLFTTIDTIKQVLSGFLAPVETQHALTTQKVDFQSANAATARTYVTAQHFGVGEELKGEMWVVWAWYDDELVKVGEGQWRVWKRVVGLHHSPIGNQAIFAAKSTIAKE